MRKRRKKNRSRWIILSIIVIACGIIYHICREYSIADRFYCDDTLYAGEIKVAAAKYALPPQLVRALIKKESRFKKNTVGKAGEIGLMQILPRGAVAEWARINKCEVPSRSELFKVENNLDIGCWYLARAVKKWSAYRYKYELALAEYNAGAKNTARWKPKEFNGEVLHHIDFPGTRNYVMEIMQSYREYLVGQKP